MLDALGVSTNEQATIRWIKPFIVLDIRRFETPLVSPGPTVGRWPLCSDPYRLGLLQLGAFP